MPTITLPLFLFSATFYPVSAYGDWAWLAQLSPLYHGVVVARGLNLGEWSWTYVLHVGVLVAMALVGVSLLMTVGVYGLVAGIVKLDDAGLFLSRRTGDGGWAKFQRGLGRGGESAEGQHGGAGQRGRTGQCAKSDHVLVPSRDGPGHPPGCRNPAERDRSRGRAGPCRFTQVRNRAGLASPRLSASGPAR